jgi:16S rRNA (guanine966-N2)-methyltransferase
VVFVDPPYGKGLGEIALASAADGGWLSPGAIAILEEDVASEVTIPAGFTLVDERKVGDSRVRFLAFGAAG